MRIAMMMKRFVAGLLFAMSVAVYGQGHADHAPDSVPAQAPAPASTSVVLFNNVRVFDGQSDQLSEPINVLVRGNIIERISADPIATDRRADTVLIDGGGRTLLAGLIDNHWHTMLVRPTPTSLLTDDLGYITLTAGAEANDTLMRGFTTVRDLGGP